MTDVDPNFIIFSGACWGVVLNDSVARRPWTSQDSNRHINEVELIAALNAPTSLPKCCHPTRIRKRKTQKTVQLVESMYYGNWLPANNEEYKRHKRNKSVWGHTKMATGALDSDGKLDGYPEGDPATGSNNT
jgi:hypothetical protein